MARARTEKDIDMVMEIVSVIVSVCVFVGFDVTSDIHHQKKPYLPLPYPLSRLTLTLTLTQFPILPAQRLFPPTHPFPLLETLKPYKSSH